MRIIYWFIIFFLFSSFTLFSQVDPQITLFPWLQPTYNPGAMGEKDNHLNFTGILRQSEMLMSVPKEDSNNEKKKVTPVDGQLILLHIDSYIKQIKGAVGVMFINDKRGEFSNSGFRLGYAAKLRVYGGKLGIGVQLGFLNKKQQGNYHPNQSGDQTVPTQAVSFLDFDMNLGLHYAAPTWYVGVSCTNLLKGIRVSGDGKSILGSRQLYFSGGYIWNLKTSTPWTIEPSILVHSEFATWHLQVMALARYNGLLWFGVSYHLHDGIAAILGALPFYNNSNVYLKGMEIGLAYTFGSKATNYIAKGGSWGDFELLIRYGFNFYKEKILTGYGSSRHLYKNQY